MIAVQFQCFISSDSQVSFWSALYQRQLSREVYLFYVKKNPIIQVKY